MLNNSLAKFIDHTLLKADATDSAIIKLCEEAKQHGFATVCVNPQFVALAASQLKGSGVGVCTVAGFPLGANRTEVKVLDARLALEDGADEVDMVINVSALKDKRNDFVRADIEAVAKICQQFNKKLKVILETCLLTDEEKMRACVLSKEAGADFVKTSTGFSTGGATVADIALMRKTVGPEMGVKASGGVKDLATAKAMIEAGATRIGTSSAANY